MNQQTLPETDANLNSKLATLRRHIQHTIVGQGSLIERLLIGLLADGHLLLEGLPGLAKTTAVHTLADGMALSFRRIQFTPDLIPGDITGTEIFLSQAGEFKFIEGPIFNEIILADEINRAPPKVQSALLEAMQERQVTVAGMTRTLPAVFQVIATQNPLEQEGTYPLPEAQLDRFLMKVELDYPQQDDELEILKRETERLQHGGRESGLAVLSPDEIIAARDQVNAIYMDEMLARYCVTLVNATRNPGAWIAEAKEWLAYGASPRATLALARCARALAYLRQRDFVEPADIVDLADDVLGHRIGLSFAARAEGITARQIIQQLVDIVPIP
ncbi:AAA family ATPase [Candidatus Tenderia electrophaga]|jgi:MoxR-like ATPase|uniref:AAA family ATPase n=1 Tax=Candidatus Tenderia electrophaga TaxID=1748243 RepID=A0A0S2THJ2_9GAMM|nr:AAA family ATPase [Candidatus Tenderia electrophaga]